MPKSKGRRNRQPIPTPQRPAAAPGVKTQPGTLSIALGYDPNKPTEQVDIVGSKDGCSEYTLADDSVVRLKSVLIDVKRAIDQYTSTGDPIYVMQTALVNNVKAPDKLKQKT